MESHIYKPLGAQNLHSSYFYTILKILKISNQVLMYNGPILRYWTYI